MKKLYTFLTLCLVSILTAGLSFAQTVLTSVDELSNSKVYTLVTPRAAITGGGVSNLATTSPDATDANQQFAIYKGEKGYYLYCMGTGKFVNYSGKSVSEAPIALSCYTFEYQADGNFFALYGADKTVRYNFNNEGNSIMDGWGATWGSSDNGNKFTITEVGDLDEATVSLIKAGIATFDNYTPISPVNGVASVADLSNNKAYYIFTKDTSRGFWGYDENSSTEHLTATSVSNTFNNDNMKFAILKSEKGNYYVYSIAAQKFVTKSGSGTGLSAFPVADSTRVITVDESDNAPFIIAIDGSHIGISQSYTNVGGIISFWQDLNDSGNRIGFVDAGEFDPTDALSYIEAQETMLFLTSQNPDLDSLCTAIPDSVELTMNKALADLAENTEVIVLHTTSSHSYEEVEGAEVTVEKAADNNRKLIFHIGNKEAFEKDGQYSFMIKDVVAEDGTVDDVEAVFMVTGIEPETPQNTFMYSSVSPAEGEPVAELNVVTVTYPAVVGFVKNDVILDVVNAENEVVANATIDFGMEWEDVAITLIEPLTENGVYTITVPEGTIYDENAVMEDDDTWDVTDCIYNPEFTIKVTVDTSTGIKTAEVIGAKSNIFTLDGKKVNHTHNKGVYIVNGKKVVK